MCCFRKAKICSAFHTQGTVVWVIAHWKPVTISVVFLDGNGDWAVTQVSRRRANPCRGLERDYFLHGHVQAEVQFHWPQAQAFITLIDTRHHFSLWNHSSYMFFYNWALRKAQWPLEVCIHSSLHCKGERDGCCMVSPPWAVLPNQTELSPQAPDCSKCCP